MNHNKKTSIESIYTSSSKIGAKYENHFVVLDDAKHVIGVDASDGRNLIFENVQNGKAYKIRWYSSSFFNVITTLVYNEDTGFLYSGDVEGHLQKFKINTSSKTCKRVKNYGNIGIDSISSSFRFMHFVFFGGEQRKIKVLDLSTDELILRHLETSSKDICSLQICLKNNKQIFLTVSGGNHNYSNDKTDLFDVSGLLSNDPIILQKYLSDYSKNQTFLKQKNSIKSQAETIQKLTKERDQYKAKFGEMRSKYDDIKEKHHLLHNQKQKLEEAYGKLKMQSETQCHQKSKMTNNKTKKTIIENCHSDEIDPLLIMPNTNEEIQVKKNLYKKNLNETNCAIIQKRAKEHETERLRVNLHAQEMQMLPIEEIIGQR